MTQITIQAYAKINLNLRVIGRRPDGFHDLDTLLQTISLCDTLVISGAEKGIRLDVDDPSIPTDSRNLVWRAAASLTPPTGRPAGLHIRLRKRIPAGGGLGGGSSDAAAALVAINRLWGAGLSSGDLAAIAANLGSDVPFFLTGGVARLTGRGNEVQPLPDMGGYGLLVVHPGVPLATREVYESLPSPLTLAPKIVSMAAFGRVPPREVEAVVRQGNDLEPPALRLCPEIGEIKDRLVGAGATAAAMTGSGSAVFGVFRGGAPLYRAARFMADLGWRAFVCEPLGRADFRRHLGLT